MFPCVGRSGISRRRCYGYRLYYLWLCRWHKNSSPHLHLRPKGSMAYAIVYCPFLLWFHHMCRSYGSYWRKFWQWTYVAFKPAFGFMIVILARIVAYATLEKNCPENWVYAASMFYKYNRRFAFEFFLTCLAPLVPYFYWVWVTENPTTLSGVASPCV